MGRFFHMAYDIVELPQIIGGNSMKKLLSIILALVCTLSVVACSTGETIPETTKSPQTQEPAKPSVDSATEAANTPTQSTRPVVTQPQQEMCWHCGDVPVSGYDIYCVNCRCLKCNQRRKLGGDYLYCSQHNCNESLCEYPAFEDSQYCSEHKCSKPNCDNRRWSGSEYCAHHK